ncbi:MAG: DUF1573 domain-containing protein [Pirellulaceae bacterium]
MRGDSRSQSVPIEFRVRNPGPNAIHIHEVQSSCNCLGADVDSRELLAGRGATRLTMNVRLTPYERTKQVSCVLVTDDPDEPHKRFSAKLNVVQPIQFEEESYDFGQLRLNDSVRREFSLTFCTRDNTPPKLVKVAGNATSLDAIPDFGRIRSTTVNGLVIHHLPVAVTFSPDETSVAVALALRASAIVDGSPVTAELPLWWRPERQFSMAPRRAILTIEDNESSPKPVSIRVTRNDQGSFRIKQVVSNNKLISASLASQTNDREAAIEVLWVAEDSLPGRFATTVVVTTDHPLEPRLIIPVVFVR